MLFLYHVIEDRLHLYALCVCFHFFGYPEVCVICIFLWLLLQLTWECVCFCWFSLKNIQFVCNYYLDHHSVAVASFPYAHNLQAPHITTLTAHISNGILILILWSSLFRFLFDFYCMCVHSLLVTRQMEYSLLFSCLFLLLLLKHFF